MVVVFHPEIRRAIVHLGDAPFFGRIFRRDAKIVPRLLRAVARLSKERIGALIAIEREASLSELSENGITIDAELNSYLIESIFFPKSALHDGGVVVQDDRIVAASCLFPLSQNPDIDKRLAEELKTLGPANVVARHLITGSPLVTIEKITLTGISIGDDEGDTTAMTRDAMMRFP